MTIAVGAPLAGWAAPLDELPDPVFAGRMLGDGVAIDPVEGEVLAPFDGTVIGLPASRHSVTLRSAAGAELLIHVGLETVALAGEGFTAHVAEGARVRAGDRLLSFDLDLVAGRARSLLTPVVLINGDAFAVEAPVTGREVRAGEVLMRLRPLAGAAAALEAQGAEIAVDVVIPLPHGLHARPAARLAARAQGFRSELAFVHGARRADVRSAVAVMTLGAGHGQALSLAARGPDAEAAIAAIRELLEAIAAEERATLGAAAPGAAMPAAASEPGVLRGVTAAPGLAIGVAHRLAAPEPVVAEESRGSDVEAGALRDALARVAAGLAAAGRHQSQRDILAAHQAFLADPDLRGRAEAAVAAGRSAGVAWREAVRETVAALKGLGDARFVERADDLLDLERQVLFALSGEEAPAPRLPGGAIVVADELLPSQLIALEGQQPAGFCTARGGATSHVAILAQAMGVPALAAMGEAILNAPEGATVILDADAGCLRVAPDRAALEAAQGALAARAARREADRAAAAEPGRTADGTRIEMLANLGAIAEARPAVGQGAEGCGLFRTEFLFLDRQDAPTEAEQTAAYQAVADALAGRPLTIRTLDAGGDKPLAFAPAPHEANPALGLRGLRAGLRAPALLRTQLAAILEVEGPVRILLPMVNDVADVRAVRGLLAELAPGRAVPLGVMVETPSAALLADQLAREADFLSLGTNDLTQYVLAMDREHAELAPRLDGLHPAVLRLIARVADACAAAGKPASVCGGLASDPLAAPLLVGLGVRSLSAAPAALPGLKARLRSLDIADCRAAALAALDLTAAEEVRALARQRFGAPP
ncbi:phosphoenolpyruvate--protein phosphotransferase [Phenylobacterium sp. J367]|uniref:phosphoenolpyruvate--protein phosphotransferase n=1 Tax=Phenylobacterium sp. J367 TaxID=2898435 RepID=UPI002151407A|nr:phosphoenolpyruvate--protein phosphotransferase [Phenylobacterium sp. J367]MCR5879378.1 phosphoenolpyruvate--protein phosphotransferase [Phenylobacterium sp. J367]